MGARSLFVFVVFGVHCGGAAPVTTTATGTPSSRPAPARVATQVTPLPCPAGDVSACTAACDAGKMTACTTLGSMLHDAGDPKASVLFERACNGGDPRGCATLAYTDAARREALFAKAFAASKAACAADRAEACSFLSYMTESGLGTPADAAESKRLDAKVSSLYRAACEAGEAASCNEIADRTRIGLGVPEDKEAARAFDARACAAKNGAACLTMSLYYTPEEDAATKAALAKQSCDFGHAAGCNFLAELAEKGQGTAKDPAAALALYVRACSGPGDVRIGVSCASAATMLTEGEVPHDETRAASLLGEACRLGYLNGCFDLARAIAQGRGVTRDPGKAIALFLHVCESSTTFPVACNEAGYLYQNEASVKNMARALELYAKACDASSGAGCNNLGMAYATATGVSKDDTKAAGLLKRSCDQRFMTGCVNLAELALSHRGGVAMDDAAITKTFAAACDANVLVGCNDLGYMFKAGRAGTKDLAKARELFDKACRGGFQLACDNAKLR